MGIITNYMEQTRAMYISGKSVKDIATEQKRTENAVRKTLWKLKKQGGIRGYKKATSPSAIRGKYRLHACHFVLHIVNKGHRFHRIKGNTGYIDSHQYIIYQNDTIHIYQSAGDEYPSSLYTDDLPSLNNLASTYWNSIFWRLQRRIDCLLLKDGIPTINYARSHIAYMDESGMVKTITKELGKGLYIYTQDHKAWLYFDFSHDQAEREYIAGHAENLNHSNIVEPYFNDLLQQNWYKPSEAKAKIDYLEANLQLASKLISYESENRATHIGLFKEISKALVELRQELKQRQAERTLASYIPSDNKLKQKGLQKSLIGWF